MVNYRKSFKEFLVENYNYDSKIGSYVDIYDTYYKYEKGVDVNDDVMLKIMELFDNREDKDHKDIFDALMGFYEKEKIVRKFFKRKAAYGYGFKVYERTFKAKPTVILHYTSYDEEKTKLVLNNLREGIDDEFPNTDGEIPPSKILKIKEKHFTQHYEIHTPEMFREKMVSHLKLNSENNQYYEPSDDTITDKLGMDASKVASLPPGSIKDFAVKELSRYNEEVKYNEKYKNYWNHLKVIIKDDSKYSLHSIYEVLEFLEGEDRCEIIEPR